MIIIIIIIIILTLDHNKYNDDTNYRQELFVLASHSLFISRLGLLPSKIRARLRDLYSCFQQNTTKIPMKIYSSPFQSNKKAQVSLSDVTELFPN